MIESWTYPTFSRELDSLLYKRKPTVERFREAPAPQSNELPGELVAEKIWLGTIIP